MTEQRYRRPSPEASSFAGCRLACRYRLHIRARSAGIELALGDLIDVHERDRTNVKPRRGPGRERAWDKHLSRRSEFLEPFVEVIDKPLRIRVNNGRRGAANIGLQLFEKLILEICEVRSPLHRRKMHYEAFRELIEGVMAGRTNG